MEVNGWLHKQGTSMQGENISKSFGIWQCVVGESFRHNEEYGLCHLQWQSVHEQSLTCSWSGTQILWLPSWQPSHYALRNQNVTLCFIFRLTVPYTTGTVAASSNVQWPGTSHSMLRSATTTEARAPWVTIPMTRRPFRSRPENSIPATLSCYNRKQLVWILPIWYHNCHLVIVHITVFCAQYKAQCVCTDLPSHNTD